MSRIKKSDEICSKLNQTLKANKLDEATKAQLCDSTYDLTRLVVGYSCELKHLDYTTHNILSYA